nr:hypothetical protein CFP56_60251 [Quercus suber]
MRAEVRRILSADHQGNQGRSTMSRQLTRFSVPQPLDIAAVFGSGADYIVLGLDSVDCTHQHCNNPATRLPNQCN